ncbi:MAG: hypothetical protein JO275_15000 [Verrucomicrobia bacterium]|nr:hypothetical protein [Verrucomicrobiota bacterium]
MKIIPAAFHVLEPRPTKTKDRVQPARSSFPEFQTMGRSREDDDEDEDDKSNAQQSEGHSLNMEYGN